MTGDAILDEFRDAGALLEGHFILSSGLRSPVFLQKMRIFEDPVRTERVCGALGKLIRETFGEVVNQALASPRCDNEARWSHQTDPCSQRWCGYGRLLRGAEQRPTARQPSS